MGGAVLIENSGNVTNCRFEDNSAEFGGAVSSDRTVNIADCNFTANRASVEGGAFYTGSCNIENSNFTNNIASNGRYSGDGGAVYINGNATVVNCDFIGNEASRGPAIYFWNLHESKHVRSISHSTFLNNKANMDSIAPFTLTVNGTNYTGSIVNSTVTFKT
jgi:predicted outer membrane repeat protein